MTIDQLQRKISGSVKLIQDVCHGMPSPSDSYGWAGAFASVGSILDTDEIPLVFKGIALHCNCSLHPNQIREFASTIIAARMVA